jgi:protein phosphatase
LNDEDTQVTLPTLTEMLDEPDLYLPQITTVGEPNVLPVSGQRPPTIGWQIASLTDVGLKREINEDNMLMWEADSDEFGAYGLYVVADGLGGHVAGEIASQLAVDAIQQRLENLPPASTSGQDALEAWLRETAKAANEAILQRQQDDGEVKKMGSTLVMALVMGHTARVINVGDSRAYRLSPQKIEQISTDHSLVERLVQIGQITREEARTHKQRNVIYSTLGEKRRMEIGYYETQLDPNDRLLLCSDGLSEKVPDELILHISRNEADPAAATQLLVEAAKQAGGDDNITVVLVQINKDDSG